MKLSKVRTAEEIIARFKDGQIIAIGGQTNQYMPDRLIDCVLESGARHLTIYSIDSSDPGHGVSLLVEAGRVDAMITTHVGTNPLTNAKIQSGALKAEFNPMGTFIERIRCGGAGLGGLQVSAQGDLANWATPGRAFGMGGAMDLCNGARKVIVAMELVAKDGSPKVVSRCTLPLTAVKCVNHIVTDRCVIDVTEEGLVLSEIRKGHTVEEIQAAVEPVLLVSPDLKEMEED